MLLENATPIRVVPSTEIALPDRFLKIPAVFDLLVNHNNKDGWRSMDAVSLFVGHVQINKFVHAVHGLCFAVPCVCETLSFANGMLLFPPLCN